MESVTKFNMCRFHLVVVIGERKGTACRWQFDGNYSSFELPDRRLDFLEIILGGCAKGCVDHLCIFRPIWVVQDVFHFQDVVVGWDDTKEVNAKLGCLTKSRSPSLVAEAILSMFSVSWGVCGSCSENVSNGTDITPRRYNKPHELQRSA